MSSICFWRSPRSTSCLQWHCAKWKKQHCKFISGKTASMVLWLAASKSGQKYWVTTSNPIASSFSLITPNDVLYTDFDFFGSKQYKYGIHKALCILYAILGGGRDIENFGISCGKSKFCIFHVRKLSKLNYLSQSLLCLEHDYVLLLAVLQLPNHCVSLSEGLDRSHCHTSSTFYSQFFYHKCTLYPSKASFCFPFCDLRNSILFVALIRIMHIKQL